MEMESERQSIKINAKQAKKDATYHPNLCIVYVYVYITLTGTLVQ